VECAGKLGQPTGMVGQNLIKSALNSQSPKIVIDPSHQYYGKAGAMKSLVMQLFCFCCQGSVEQLALG
jgi:hypothetical protein